MTRFELAPQQIYQIAEKVGGIIASINPEDEVYKTIFEGLPESNYNQWVTAIKDGASIVGLSGADYGRELVHIAIENGLAPRGVRRLPRDLFADLLKRSDTLRASVYAREGFGSSPTHSLYSHITTKYGRKR